MPTFKLNLVEKNYIELEIEANTIEEAKERALLRYPPDEDNKDHIVVEVYNEDWDEL